MKVTVANFSEANQEKRLDSQFFYPIYVRSFDKVVNSAHVTVSEIAHVSDGNHLKIAEEFDGEMGVRYLRGQDISRNMILEDRNNVYIPEESFNSLKRSHIFKEDILVTIVGANTGLTGLVYDPPKKLVANCKLGIIRVNKKRILPGYLYAFLIGQYGQHQILRSVRGGGQTGLVLPDMRQLRIARFSENFEREINDFVYTGHEKIIESKDVYSQAQMLLLAELGLANWQPKHRLSFVRNSSEVEKSARIDAEYFQPKYDEIVNAIKSYAGGWDTLDNLCSVVGHPSNPPYADDQNEDKTFVVTQKHLGDFHLNDNFWKDEDALYTTKEFMRKNRQYALTQGDVLLYSVGAYIGKANIYQGQIKATIGSFLTLLRAKPEKLNPYYLMVFLNTEIGTEISKQHQRGMAQQYLYPYDIRTFPIPLLEEYKQAEIQQKVSESFALRAKSKSLLEAAKRAVEMAIEEGEEKALAWLEAKQR